MSAQWPSAVSTASNLYTTVNLLTTTLSVSMTASTPSTVTIASTTGFPTAGAVTIDNEVIFYTGVSGSTLTGLTRGADGTTAASHNSGVPVGATIVAYHVNAANAEIIAIETDLHTRLGYGSTLVTMPAGSAAAPTLVFSGATTSGFFSDGGNVSVSMAGTAVTEWNGSAFYPVTNNNYDLGTTGFRFKTVYAVSVRSSTLTGSTAVYADSNSQLASSTTTNTELDFVHGVTSAIQTQINTKAPTASPTFTGVVTAAAGAVGAPSVTLGDSTTGLYRSGSGKVDVALSGVLAVEFQSTGASDGASYTPVILGGGGGTASASLDRYTQSSVAATPAQIFAPNTAEFVLVYGFDGSLAKFLDIIVCGFVAVGPTVVSQTTLQGSPGTRTYTMPSNGVVKLAMSSGTYTVNAVGIGLNTR